ncbi:hypothetical protein CHS0354_017155 [Potamilus streckersoni]|uniref:Uncharacterized protein n=1 Tax=Potamilus streckersoni TaxID=2493646 RepID=A0AAE0W5D8_9BIVA|nr:hypothetical protein CHS0354_017155 [Potamilus streckersoni]
MLAAASTGNVSVTETLVLQGGNIKATISGKQRNANDLSNVIKNCISHPKISRYHHDINLLHIACRYGRMDMVTYLINNIPEHNDNDGWTAIHYAAAKGSAPVIEALTQAGLDLNVRTNAGSNVLIIAVMNDNLPIVKYLIENNPSLTLQNDMDGWTAIHYTAKRGGTPVIEALMQAGLDLNARTNVGAQVLHIAALHDNLKTNDKNGWTAIHYVVKGGSAPVIEALIEAGIDINARTNAGAKVLHIAAGNNNLPIALIEAGIDINARTNAGAKVLHIAAGNNNLPIVKYLIEINLAITLQNDNDGRQQYTMLLKMADLTSTQGLHTLGNDNLPMVEYVIIMNPQIILEKDKDGWTALDYANHGDSFLVMETQIQAGLGLID